MRDKDLYAQLLGIESLWQVSSVEDEAYPLDQVKSHNKQSQGGNNGRGCRHSDFMLIGWRACVIAGLIPTGFMFQFYFDGGVG